MKAMNLAVTLCLAATLASIPVQGEDQKFSVLEKAKAIRDEVAAQNEDGIVVPAPQPRAKQGLSEQRNLYFGDTHVHTALSFDAYLSFNRLSLDDAYRFANGETLTLVTGEIMQLSRPLDFVVMTDHAESYGLFVTCARDGLSEEQREFCQAFERPNRSLFQKLREDGQKRPPIPPTTLCGGMVEACQEDARTTWREVRATAEKYNRPGEFTAFAGYEYSPPLPNRGKIHRNVIFRNSKTPNRAVSAFDAATELDLWKALESECTGECEFLTIPHNMNKTWGLAYAGRTIDGDIYQKSDWALRARNEPLAEIFQAKGSSECGFGVGATDEECNFELIVPVCEGPQVAGCSGPTSFVREGLKIGLQLERELGFNPLQFGFIGSTDTHSSAPGDTEEYDWRGVGALHESPARKRLQVPGANDLFQKQNSAGSLKLKNPGGLAAVWARENTRDDIFEALQSRETYATSGTRIALRVFAGWQYSADILRGPDLLEAAYRGGVPMGGVLEGQDEPDRAPQFLVWAAQDPMAAPLQKIQMVKAWVDGSQAHEEVVDIACSDDLVPDAKTKRCPDNAAQVDLKSCSVSADKGSSELKVHWQDPDFDPAQEAVYYVRVLENPSCRWSSYDAIRIGSAPLAELPATIRERAWSSPIWYKPAAQ